MITKWPGVLLWKRPKAVKYGGLSEIEALKLVTINAAKQLQLDKNIGSLEPGKDADFVIWNGNPLSTYSLCEQTWIDGQKYFDRADDLRLRKTQEEERTMLIQRLLEDKDQKKDDKKDEKKDEKKSIKTGGEENDFWLSDWADSRTNTDEEALNRILHLCLRINEKRIRRTNMVLYFRINRFSVFMILSLLLQTTLGWSADQIPAFPQKQPVALSNACIHPVSGAVIPKGTILFDNGKIVALGESLSVPSGTRLVDVAGRCVYPGFIAVNTLLGLMEITQESITHDIAENPVFFSQYSNRDGGKPR